MSATQEQVKQGVRDQLFWDNRVDASDIHIDINQGIITLTGTVPSYLARQAAETDAWSIPGVVAVNNKLDIRYQAAVAIPSDQEIESNIRDAFIWNPNLYSSQIMVSVDNRMVILKGSVDSYWKKRLAEDLVFDIRGVHSVKNELAVVPTVNFSDDAVANTVVAALDRNVNVDINAVDVKVENGRVTLDGSVRSWIAFRSAQETAERTPGVVNVVNHLVIA